MAKVLIPTPLRQFTGKQDAVVVITSGVKDMQAVLNLVWDRLLPALKPARLPADAAGRQKLDRKLASLSVRTVPVPGAPSPLPSGVGRKYVFPANDQKLETLAVEVGGGGAVTLVNNGVAAGAGVLAAGGKK